MNKKRVSIDFDLDNEIDGELYGFLVSLGGKTSAVKFSLTMLMNNFYNNMHHEPFEPKKNTISNEVKSDNIANKVLSERSSIIHAGMGGE